MQNSTQGHHSTFLYNTCDHSHWSLAWQRHVTGAVLDQVSCGLCLDPPWNWIKVHWLSGPHVTPFSLRAFIKQKDFNKLNYWFYLPWSVHLSQVLKILALPIAWCKSSYSTLVLQTLIRIYLHDVITLWRPESLQISHTAPYFHKLHIAQEIMTAFPKY